MNGRKFIGKTIIIALLFSILALAGCEGSDTREQVDNTVEEFTGKKKVDQMKDMEKSVGQIEDLQSEKLKEMDDME
jgi:hypothetical protein